VHQGFSQAILVEIPNGVDLSQFSVRPAQRREGVPHLTYIGRLDKYKGVTFLLKGFKELLSRAGAVRLTIVGDGPDEFLLKAMAREIDIDERVTFRGRQEEVLSEYHRTTIFVLPSLSEGMSNVLLEAMACGLPVVATSVGGNSDIITDRHNGLLVPPGDALTLSTALLELLENDDFAQRLGEAARKTVELNYGMERIVERYLALYSRLGS
jgi:glycosyltransferase involved in cell wall biosynthesis